MRTVFGNSIIFLFGFVIGIIVFYNYNTRQKYKLNYDTITIYKNIIKQDTIIKTKLIPYNIIRDSFIYIPKDSTECFLLYDSLYKLFHQKVYYRDSIIIDTLGYFGVNQIIYKNKIDSLTYYYNIKTYEKLVHIQNNNLNIGILIGKEMIAPMLMYNNRRYTYYTGYNFNNNGIMLGFAIKIK